MPIDDAELLLRMRSRRAPTAALLGMDLFEIDSAAGRAKFRMLCAPQFCNPMGNLQGGIITTALDDAAATAIIAKAGRRVGVPTIELKVSFFGPARMDSSVFAEGRVVKFGRTITFAEADLTDETGKLLARLTTSVMVVEVEGPGHFVDAGRKPQ
ncbi:MAG: PaaI family thioesterase [Sandarakinorhabdus sp.]|nr:PaaI family thioesterase [Sandarakinorhabdus sp.]